MGFPGDTWRNNNVIITSNYVAASFWRYNEILLRRVYAGFINANMDSFNNFVDPTALVTGCFCYLK